MSMAGDKFNEQEENGDNAMGVTYCGCGKTEKPKTHIAIMGHGGWGEKSKMKQVLRPGWLPFANLLNKYGVKRDGNEYRKLKKIGNKVNLSESNTPYWIVEEDEFKKVFEVG